MTEVIEEKQSILKQLEIWSKMSQEEREQFESCQTENEMLRLQVKFRHKYL
jgi:flagellar biosynthesis/type III secretory pathway chaperone